MRCATKFTGPTDHRGARVRVRHGAGRARFYSWDHALDGEANHALAACRAWLQRASDEGLNPGREFILHAYVLVLPDACEDFACITLRSYATGEREPEAYGALHPWERVYTARVHTGSDVVFFAGADR